MQQEWIYRSPLPEECSALGNQCYDIFLPHPPILDNWSNFQSYLKQVKGNSKLCHQFDVEDGAQ